MFDVSIFTDIEMAFTEREKAFCVLVYARSQSSQQDCAACICEGVLKTVASRNPDLDMAQKIQKGRLFVQEKRIWMTKKIRAR